MKLLRTIRLDPSDTFVFERAAEPGEWAVTGSFVFWNADLDTMEGKERTAFRSGFLGVQSLGWSTLVQIVEAAEHDRVMAVEALAAHLAAQFGAPSLDEAIVDAEQEFVFASSLCTPPEGTLIAIHRGAEAGEIRETFRSLRPREGAKPLRAFAFLDVEGEEEEEPGERIDLAALSQHRSGKP